MGLADIFGADDRIELSVPNFISMLQVTAEKEAEMKYVRNVIDAGVPITYIKAMLDGPPRPTIDDYIYRTKVDGPYYGKEDMCSDE